MPNTLMGQLRRADHRDAPCKADVHPGEPGSTDFLAEARVFFHGPGRRMQQEAITFTPESVTHLPPAFLRRPKPMLTRDTTKYLHAPWRPIGSMAFTSVPFAPLPARGVNCCAQSLAAYRSLLAASSTFHLLFKVLFIFRSRYFSTIGLLVIFSFRRELPPTLV